MHRKAVRVAAVAAALAVAALAVPAASAAPHPNGDRRVQMQQLLAALRAQYAAPGAGFTYGDGHGDVTLSSGTGDVLATHPITARDKVRVGSDTKMFVAVVVLQLVAEGRLDLEAPVDRYLPGVLRYAPTKVPTHPEAYDGRTVTLHQLLQHTSGVPDYGSDLGYVLNPVHQVRAPRPEELVAYALRKGPTHRPGAAWAYSNTDYTLLGMVVTKVTGHRLGVEIDRRIAGPLGLRDTFYAEAGQRDIPGRHVHGYLTQLVPVDMTGLEPAVWGAAGALVSSADDMNAFTSALLAGRVLAPAQLAAMQTTVPYLTGGYGLGIVSIPLSCGTVWGHAGFVAGYQTFGLALPGGRHGFLTFNTSVAVSLTPPTTPATVADLFELALC